jgi:hypothetical protein
MPDLMLTSVTILGSIPFIAACRGGRERSQQDRKGKLQKVVSKGGFHL